jgi:serine/threonine protein kinase
MLYSFHREARRRRTFSAATVVGIAHSIASAAHHLHTRQLMHGDLYGHNILVHGAHALLGDFGAASFNPSQDPAQAHSLQRVEVRAFGYLLHELLAHSSDLSAADSTGATLHALCADCLNTTVEARPLFAAIEQTLAGLQDKV